MVISLIYFQNDNLVFIAKHFSGICHDLVRPRSCIYWWGYRSSHRHLCKIFLWVWASFWLNPWVWKPRVWRTSNCNSFSFCHWVNHVHLVRNNGVTWLNCQCQCLEVALDGSLRTDYHSIEPLNRHVLLWLCLWSSLNNNCGRNMDI